MQDRVLLDRYAYMGPDHDVVDPFFKECPYGGKVRGW
jgi:hypothetical protein